jgi:hypothetical protein
MLLRPQMLRQPVTAAECLLDESKAKGATRFQCTVLVSLSGQLQPCPAMHSSPFKTMWRPGSIGTRK